MPAELPQSYAVRITFEADGDASEIADLLTRTFSGSFATVATPTGVRADDGTVTVEFDRLDAADPHSPGPERPAPEGQAVVEAAARVHFEATALVPVVRAAMAASAARARAGLPPRQRVIIEVEPAEPPDPEHFDGL
jgi:hypothetical protein